MPRRVHRLRAAIGLGAALLASAAPAGPPTGGRFVDYLHVEAGSGTSGGGHAGLRIGGTTYHYVYTEPGIIRSTAETNASFDYSYRALGNRSIHVRRIAVDDEAYQALADSFSRRHLTQQAHLDLLDAAESDQALIAYLAGHQCRDELAATAIAPPRLPGGGYFLPTSATASVATLRAAIGQRYGADYLIQRTRTLAGEISALTPPTAHVPEVVQWQMPVQDDGFAARYRALATAALAIDVLLHDRAPDPAGYRTLPAPASQLSDAELAALREREVQLQSSLLRLVVSSRPDWGYPMLIGMARLVALDASLQSGQLVIPDAFDDGVASLPVAQLLADRPVAMALVRERRDEFDAARAALATALPQDEAAWSRFEMTASAWLELQDAVQRGVGSVRAYPRNMLPSRGAAAASTAPLPVADCATLAQWRADARQAADALRDRLREVYRYDVISRNCVTEIFRTMDAAGATPGAGRPADAGLGFMPFVSAGAVDAGYPVVAHETLPSYRRLWLAKLAESRGRVRTALRESNTLTATLRHPDERDDVFLFYTEEASVLRPVYGAVNMGVGAGAMVAGLVTLPFDRGQRLTTGARSLVFSVPELGFINVRKGRNSALPQDWMRSPE